MEVLKFYTKPDCPLCNEVRDVLDLAGMDWDEINILDHPDLFSRYRHDIPVIESSKGTWFYRERNTVPLAGWLEMNA